MQEQSINSITKTPKQTKKQSDLSLSAILGRNERNESNQSFYKSNYSCAQSLSVFQLPDKFESQLLNQSYNVPHYQFIVKSPNNSLWIRLEYELSAKGKFDKEKNDKRKQSEYMIEQKRLRGANISQPIRYAIKEINKEKMSGMFTEYRKKYSQ